MGDPIERAGSGAGPVASGNGPRARGVRPGTSFSRLLREEEDHGLAELARGAARSIARGEQTIDRAIRAARAGRVFSHEELLALQAGVYRYTQELELASKLVDKATSAVRTTLQSQQ